MTEHSQLPPSSASRRIVCPGSRALEAQFPNDDSQSAREGNAAHWVASELLNFLIKGTVQTLKIEDTAINGELITQEMIDGATLYVNQIQGVLDSSFLELQIEKRVDIKSIHPSCWGTPDCWTVGNSGLHLFDYKFGFGFVEVFENWQLIEYAAGILDIINANSRLSKQFSACPVIHFYIIQPRSYHPAGPIKTWSITFTDLQSYFEKLKFAENIAMQENAFCLPSSECTYCTGRHACIALQNIAFRTADLASSNNPHILTSENLGVELRYLKDAAEVLDARVTGLEAQAMSEIREGKRIPFFRIEHTRGRDYWTISAEEVIKMGEILNCNLAKSQDAITPKQALKKGFDKQLISKFSKTTSGNPRLVREEEIDNRKLFKG